MCAQYLVLCPIENHQCPFPPDPNFPSHFTPSHSCAWASSGHALVPCSRTPLSTLAPLAMSLSSKFFSSLRDQLKSFPFKVL